MRRRRQAAVIVVLALVCAWALLGVVVDLRSGGSRILWRGVTVPGHLAAHYRYFNGTYGRRFDAHAGEELQLHYVLQPDKGVLDLYVVRPDGSLLWSRHASSAMRGTLHLVLPVGGSYRIRLRGVATRGSFDVRYSAVPGAGGG